MLAASQFVDVLIKQESIQRVQRVQVELFGSLGATGKGHGSDKAILLGLMGETPAKVNVPGIPDQLDQVRSTRKILLNGVTSVAFNEATDLILHRRKSLPYHPNAMSCVAYGKSGEVLERRVFYSVGGGFVVDEAAATDDNPIKPDTTQVMYPYSSAAELLQLCNSHKKSISDIIMANETAWRSQAQVTTDLLELWEAMQACVRAGCVNEGVLPGGLQVRRRAPDLYATLRNNPEAALSDPLTIMDWISLYALAVNEENAAGGRVVTAPTNGAAGIIPAVLHYYTRFVPGANEQGVINFLLTAGAIGILYKENASISGAEVGCQGEVGSACSMAAGALAAVSGGTPEQIENAAEIGMEHNLGLTCDPVGGLVQVPCIERNAMGSVKAVNAARMALRGDGLHFVTLDKVIKTMRDTGADMKTKYKETSRGGLAINVVEVPVNFPEC